MSGELLDAQLAQNNQSSWQCQIGESCLENSYVWRTATWRTATSGKQLCLENSHVWRTVMSGEQPHLENSC